MPRIRSIKPDFWTDEKVVELSAFARLLFIGLWNLVDDEGRMEFSPLRVKMQIFPADNLDISELFGEIRGKKLVDVYTVDGQEFLSVKNFSKHQKIDKRTASKFPPPPNSPELPQKTPLERKGKGKEEDISLGASDDAPADDRAEEFWQTYPSRQNHPNPKKPALDKFRLAVKRGADPGAIIAGARQYADYVKATNKDPEHVAQAVTWINQRRWEDQPEQPKARPKW